MLNKELKSLRKNIDLLKKASRCFDSHFKPLLDRDFDLDSILSVITQALHNAYPSHTLGIKDLRFHLPSLWDMEKGKQEFELRLCFFDSANTSAADAANGFDLSRALENVTNTIENLEVLAERLQKTKRTRQDEEIEELTRQLHRRNLYIHDINNRAGAALRVNSLSCYHDAMEGIQVACDALRFPSSNHRLEDIDLLEKIKVIVEEVLQCYKNDGCIVSRLSNILDIINDTKKDAPPTLLNARKRFIDSLIRESAIKPVKRLTCDKCNAKCEDKRAYYLRIYPHRPYHFCYECIVQEFVG